MTEQQSIKTVMVLGARGNLGPHLIPALGSSGFKVTVLSRSAVVDNPVKTSITYAQSDYTLTSLTSAFKNQDAVIATIATHDVHVQRTIVDACVAAGVKRFLPSEFGSDTSLVKKDERAGFLRWKGEVLDYVKEREISGLTWTAIYTGAWIDWLLEEGYLSWDLKAKKGTLYDSGTTTFTVSTLQTVVNAIVAVLHSPQLTQNQCVHVSSFNLTQTKILEAVERVSGAKYEMETMNLDELYAIGEKHVEEGEWELGYGELVTATVYSGTELVRFEEKAQRWNELLGIEIGETFDEMIKRVLEKIEGK